MFFLFFRQQQHVQYQLSISVCYNYLFYIQSDSLQQQPYKACTNTHCQLKTNSTVHVYTYCLVMIRKIRNIKSSQIPVYINTLSLESTDNNFILPFFLKQRERRNEVAAHSSSGSSCLQP